METLVERETHARLSPSNHRWPHCPGSVREEAAYPDIPGAAAIDGTGTHKLLEMCLQNNVRAQQYIGEIVGVNHVDNPNGWLVHEDRAERAQMCLDYISARVKALKGQFPGSRVTVEAESKSNPGGHYGRDDWEGTCDVTITVINDHHRCMHMEVIDYKDGRGWVSAEGNTQLISYLGGKLLPFAKRWGQNGVTEIAGGLKMTICQPKTNPVIRSQEVAPDDLMRQLNDLAHAARLTDDPNAPLIPDNKGGKGYCQWCKHKPNCKARTDQGLEIIRTMDITPTTGTGVLEQLASMVARVKDLTNEQLADLADAEPGMIALFDQVRTEVEARVEAGLEVPGFAMVPSNGKNVWAFDEEETAKKLKAKRLTADDIYPKKLASPAQILKNPKLTPKQREAVQKELVTYLAGDSKLGRVQRKDKDKPTPQDMFKDVPKTSFF